MALNKEDLIADLSTAFEKENLEELVDAIASAIESYVKSMDIKLKISGKHKDKVDVDVDKIE
jgi:hypothetical protein